MITLVTPAPVEGAALGDALALALGLAVGAFVGLAETFGVGDGLALAAAAEATGATPMPTQTRARAIAERAVRAIFTRPPHSTTTVGPFLLTPDSYWLRFTFRAERVTVKGYLGERNMTLR